MAVIVNSAARVSSKQLVRTLVSVCATQEQLDKLPGSVVKGLLAVPYVFLVVAASDTRVSHVMFRDVETELVGAMAWMGAERFLSPLVNSLLAR